MGVAGRWERRTGVRAENAHDPKEAVRTMSADAAGSSPPLHSAGVLADRIAAALVHREPGWRLPRRSALARRYNVSLGEIDVALRDLAQRSLVRRLPDGQLYRASPADYWIPVEGATGLGTRLDPMGSPIECHARHASLREAPQDVAWAIGVKAGMPVQVVRCVWTLAGEPAAISTVYLPESSDGEQVAAAQAEADLSAQPDSSAQPDFGVQPDFSAQLDSLPGLSAKPASVSLEMCPPQPSAARSLRLTPGQPVITVTIRFEDRELGTPAGLTVVLLRPELFRVAIDTAPSPTRRSPAESSNRLDTHRQLLATLSRDAGRARDAFSANATSGPLPRPEG